MNSTAHANRVIRAFISSTFRDMHAEWDYLSRQVFPELRSRCQKRGAEFIALDLRWGVTKEEAQREGASPPPTPSPRCSSSQSPFSSSARHYIIQYSIGDERVSELLQRMGMNTQDAQEIIRTCGTTSQQLSPVCTE